MPLHGVPALTSLAITCGLRKGETREFLEQADLWRARHGGTIVTIEPCENIPARFRQLVQAVEEHAPELLAIFDHGLASRLPRLGATIANAPILAAALARASTAPKVELFTCLAGEDLTPGPHGPPGGDGGYADTLRDACVKSGATGVQVDAHGSSSQLAHRARDLGGHTTHNPFVRRFLGPERKGAVGGQWLVDPASAQWFGWVKWVSDGLGWREFPVMTAEQIEEQITG